MFLLQLRALHKFHTIEGGNTRDEITSLLLFFPQTESLFTGYEITSDRESTCT